MDKKVTKDLDQLLHELQANREDLQSKVKELEKITNDLDKLLPKEYKPTNRYVIEDRIKLITTLYESILKYRSEIAKSIQNEIDIVSKLGTTDEDLSVKVSNLLPQDLKNVIKQINEELEHALPKRSK